MQRTPYRPRQAFHHPHTSMGAAGHWVREAGILAPLVIGEFVKDADERLRYIRMGSVATALLSEALWTSRIRHERRVHEAERERYEPLLLR
jgi:hypothetical protein